MPAEALYGARRMRLGYWAIGLGYCVFHGSTGAG